MEFPNCLNNFVAQAKADIAEYMEENEIEDAESYFEEMEHLLFNFNSPEIDVGDIHYQLARKRDCYEMINNDAETLCEIIEWVSVQEIEWGYDFTEFSEGITKIFAMAWYLVGTSIVAQMDKKPTMAEIKALVADLA